MDIDDEYNYYDGYKIPKQFDRTEWLENAIKQYRQPYIPIYPRWWFEKLKEEENKDEIC